MEDKTSYSFEDVRKMQDSDFIPYKIENVRLTTRNYWLRFRFIQNDIKNHYIFKSSPILYEDIEFYYVNEGKIVKQKSSNCQNINKRNLTSLHLAFELPYSQDTLTGYLHVVDYEGVNYFFDIISLRKFVKDEYQNHFETFFLLGSSFIILLMSLVFYFFLKEKVYLFYSVFTLFVIMARLVHSQYLVDFLPFELVNPGQKFFYNLYSICYVGITLSSIFYIYFFINVNTRNKFIYKTLIVICCIRMTMAFLYVLDQKETYAWFLNNGYLDLAIQSFGLIIIYQGFRNDKILGITSLISFSILLAGNFLKVFNIPTFISPLDSFASFMNISTFETLIFVISIGYRYYHIQKENEIAQLTAINKIKENEELQSNLNKELEIRVADRTQQISFLNDILKRNNIELNNEIEDITKARAFQKIMSFQEFTKIFPDENSCYIYLSNIKWKNDSFKCVRCDYSGYKLLANFSRKCQRCNYIESSTVNTIFQGVKFSIQKAFYITYLTSTGSKENTIEESAKMLELRVATYWSFRQKVLALIEKTKSRRKHKDGWTHLIEYSIGEK
ncbi:MAG: 7TM diverse intracellular signaling domain-containing protein [Bacteroidota bacterium]|nr:7TM diverse intracellular signaling domain-containing protein [Bacteroidota bacterium]